MPSNFLTVPLLFLTPASPSQALPTGLPGDATILTSLALTAWDACILVPGMECLLLVPPPPPHSALWSGRLSYVDPLPFDFRLGLANGVTQQKIRGWEGSELGVPILWACLWLLHVLFSGSFHSSVFSALSNGSVPWPPQTGWW